MRRTMLLTLALVPVLAHAQASPQAGTTPSNSSVVLLARAESPLNPILAAAAYTTPAAAAVPPGAKTNAMTKVALHQVVKAVADPAFTESALEQGGTLAYTIRLSEPQQLSSPKVVRSVELGFSQNELAAQPATSEVAVRVTVDQFGFPRDPVVVHSAGATVNERALQAISQYRFQPATVDNRPVQAFVTIDVKLQKQ
jgi:Gram-negative bacterial TonB protein C-terminal